MLPTLFHIGSFPIHSYSVCLLIGFLVAYGLIRAEFRERGIASDFALTEITLGLSGALAGSRVFHALEHWNSPARWSGLTWYGGLIVAAALILLAAKLRRIPLRTLMDASAPAIALGYGIGRLGCLLAGDACYGAPCHHLPSPFCMSFPHGQVPTLIPVYNTPLLEFVGAVLLFAYLRRIRRSARRGLTAPGALFGQFLLFHGVLRFTVEWIRINPPLAWGLSQAQWLSLALMVLGGLLAFRIEVAKPEFRA